MLSVLLFCILLRKVCWSRRDCGSRCGCLLGGRRLCDSGLLCRAGVAGCASGDYDVDALGRWACSGYLFQRPGESGNRAGPDVTDVLSRAGHHGVDPTVGPACLGDRGLILLGADCVGLWVCREASAIERAGECGCVGYGGWFEPAHGIGQARSGAHFQFDRRPSVVGWLRPVILLPMSAVTGLAPDQLGAVLAHELAHIRRHDYLVNLLQMAAEALLFYHPAVWWVSGRIRVEREFCCDDLAVSVCQNAVTYARALSTLEKLRPAIPAIAMGSTGGPLLARIQRILGRQSAECGPSRLSAVLAVSIGIACIAVSFLRAQDAVGDGKVRVIARGLSIDYQTPIEYPAWAVAAGAQGLVTVTVTTDAAGYVTDAALIENTRKPAPRELQQLVLDAIRFAFIQPASLLTFNSASSETACIRR